MLKGIRVVALTMLVAVAALLVAGCPRMPPKGAVQAPAVVDAR